MKGVNCATCDAAYHNSCAQRKTCCDPLVIIKEKNQMDSVQCATEESYLKEIIQLLSRTIKDKDTIIAEKEIVIALLKDKISHMEDILSKSNVNHNQTTRTKHSNERSAKKDKECENETSKNNATKSSKAMDDKKAGSHYQKLQSKQTALMSQLIYINKNDTETPTGGTNVLQTNNEHESKTVRHMKKRRLQIGQAQISEEDENNGFAGRELQEKKIWLFISRVKDHVTEEMIVSYLKNKTNGDSQIYIKEIKAHRKAKDNRCFKIGLNFNMKEDAYNNNFWPRGVAVCRFDFRKEEKYLDRLRNEEQETSNFQLQHQLQNSN
nr:uncharacterized protein LOC111507981 [Leptinotarsa decemlineata]